MALLGHPLPTDLLDNEDGSRGRFAQEYRFTAFGGSQLSGIADRLNPGLGPFGCC